MATLIGDIANWAAVTILHRPDLLGVAVGEALSIYQLTCEKVPFEELQETSSEQPCSLGVATYSLTSLDPAVAGIVSIRMAYSSTNKRRLRRSHVRLYDNLNYSSNGRPSTYARWGRSIEFDRTCESADFTYRIRYWSTPTIPNKFGADVEVKAATELITPIAWDELFQWETLFRLYYIDGQIDRAISLMAPRAVPKERMTPRKVRTDEIGIIPRLWNDLLKTVAQREHVDEDFSINPVVREYTW